VITRNTFSTLLYASVTAIALVGCEGKQPEQEAVVETVSYNADVRPILEAKCLSCHVEGGEGYEKTGLDMQSYDALMSGTRFGPVINPGDALSSTLVILVEGRGDPSIKMPHGAKDGLTDQEIAVIRTWIDQGAKNN
jgi:uncharacterized membrane protein